MVKINSLACTICVLVVILYTVLYRDHNIYIEIMKRVVQSKVIAECAFEIIKREVQRNVAAECRYHNIYDEIMKRVPEQGHCVRGPDSEPEQGHC